MGLKADVSHACTRSLPRPQGSRAAGTCPVPLRHSPPLSACCHPVTRSHYRNCFKLALFLSNTMKSRAVRLPPPWLRPAAACEPLSSPQATTTLPSALQCSRAQHLILLFVSRVITSLCLIYHLGHHRCAGTGDTALSAWSSLLSPAPTGALGRVPPDEGSPVLKQVLALTPGCCSSRS